MFRSHSSCYSLGCNELSIELKKCLGVLWPFSATKAAKCFLKLSVPISLMKGKKPVFLSICEMFDRHPVILVIFFLIKERIKMSDLEDDSVLDQQNAT